MFFKKTGPLRCSFCGRAEAEVAKLIAGQAGFICDECVRVCAGLIAEEQVLTPQAARSEEPASPEDAARMLYCAFCGRPMARDEARLVAEQGAYCPACIADDSKPSA